MRLDKAPAMAPRSQFVYGREEPAGWSSTPGRGLWDLGHDACMGSRTRRDTTYYVT